MPSTPRITASPSITKCFNWISRTLPWLQHGGDAGLGQRLVSYLLNLSPATKYSATVRHTRSYRPTVSRTLALIPTNGARWGHLIKGNRSDVVVPECELF